MQTAFDFDKPVIAFTLDQEWVCDEVMAWTLDRFEEAGLPVTVFATHDTPLLRERAGRGIDIGLHPDFFQHPDHEAHLLELKAAYPGARGVRSHGLFEYSGLLARFKACGLAWDSTQQLYGCPNIRPYRHPTGLVRLPFFWEDDDYFNLAPDWQPESLGLRQPGVKCFDFHPAHLRMNAVSMDQYNAAKRGGFSEAAILAAECPEKELGILVFFRRLCAYIESQNLNVAPMGRLCEAL